MVDGAFDIRVVDVGLKLVESCGSKVPGTLCLGASGFCFVLENWPIT